jgi:hypothetical protein
MIWAWVIFIGFVLLMLALDLGVFHRKSHVVGFKESLTWSGVWISLGLAFSILVYYAYEGHWFGLGNSVDAVDKLVNTGKLAATKYLTAYVVEKSLSVDNIFVIAMVFTSLAVPPRYQHRVLFWGIIGALVMRGAMIGVGSVLVQEFHAILYFFGAFLIFPCFLTHQPRKSRWPQSGGDRRQLQQPGGGSHRLGIVPHHVCRCSGGAAEELEPHESSRLPRDRERDRGRFAQRGGSGGQRRQPDHDDDELLLNRRVGG